MLLRSNVRRGRQLPLLFAYAVEDTYTARFGQTPPPWPLAVLLGPAEENTRYHYYVLSVLRLRLRALCRLVASFFFVFVFFFFLLSTIVTWVRITGSTDFTSTGCASDHSPLLLLVSKFSTFPIWRSMSYPPFIHLDRFHHGILIGILYSSSWACLARLHAVRHASGSQKISLFL